MVYTGVIVTVAGHDWQWLEFENNDKTLLPMQSQLSSVDVYVACPPPPGVCWVLRVTELAPGSQESCHMPAEGAPAHGPGSDAQVQTPVTLFLAVSPSVHVPL
jgi:hypothetical protein